MTPRDFAAERQPTPTFPSPKSLSQATSDNPTVDSSAFQRIGDQKQNLVVCLDCGKEFPYDWQQVKMVSPNKNVA